VASDITVGAITGTVGSVPDSQVTVTQLAEPVYGSRPLRVGDAVVCWGSYNCTDGWRLWGGVLRVSEGDRIEPARDLRAPLRIRDRLESTPLTKRELVSLIRSHSSANVAEAYSGRPGAWIVRVRDVRRDSTDVLMICEALQPLVAGCPGAAPAIVRARWSLFCPPDVSVGDTLVVPALSTHSPASVLDLAGCANGLLVRWGRIRSLGLPPSEVGKAIRLENGSTQLNRVRR
jgi:hypothetical protein